MTGRHTKSVRWFSRGEIGITIGATEYMMSISEANELIGMIYAARHATPSETPDPNANALQHMQDRERQATIGCGARVGMKEGDRG